MLDLYACTAEDVNEFAHQLYAANLESLHTFEDAAQVVVTAIYDTFRQPDGKPLFALVRVFRIGLRDELPPNVRDSVTDDTRYWLALAATVGLEEAWCDRTRSQKRQAIPADENLSPMFKAAMAQLGMNLGDEMMLISTHDHEQSPHARFFLAPEAPHNPAVPDQDQFVLPYGIQSEVGMGSVFASGQCSYILVAFSLEPVSDDEAIKLSELVPFVGTLLAYYNDGPLWNG